MSDASGPVSGCVGLILILAIGSCMFSGGSDEPVKQTVQVETTVTNAVAEFAIDREARERKAKTPSEAGRASPLSDPPPTGSTILEQAIHDAFPASPPKSAKARRTASQAADFIGAAINSKGFLCARPIEAQKASTNLYGVGCFSHRGGYGRSNYLVNINTGDVDEI